MNINIKTEARDFFKSLVEILSSFKPISSLIKSERIFLAELMYQNYYYQKYDLNKKIDIIFLTKREITKQLETGPNALNNTISRLRKKGILKDNKLIKSLQIFPKEEFEFKITFKLDESKAKTTRKKV